MSEQTYYYYIQIDKQCVSLKQNREILFEAKIKTKYMIEGYTLIERITGRAYKIKIFKSSLFYRGETKIEIHDEQGKVIQTFKYNFNYAVLGMFFKRIDIYEKDQSLYLVNPVKKEPSYVDGEDVITGYYDNTPHTSYYDYKFKGEIELKNPFNLFICCFCHKALSWPNVR